MARFLLVWCLVAAGPWACHSSDEAETCEAETCGRKPETQDEADLSLFVQRAISKSGAAAMKISVARELDSKKQPQALAGDTVKYGMYYGATVNKANEDGTYDLNIPHVGVKSKISRTEFVVLTSDKVIKMEPYEVLEKAENKEKTVEFTAKTEVTAEAKTEASMNEPEKVLQKAEDKEKTVLFTEKTEATAEAKTEAIMKEPEKVLQKAEDKEKTVEFTEKTEATAEAKTEATDAQNGKATPTSYDGHCSHPVFGADVVPIVITINENGEQGSLTTMGMTEAITITRRSERILFSDTGEATKLDGTIDGQGVIQGEMVQDGVRGGSFVLNPVFGA